MERKGPAVSRPGRPSSSWQGRIQRGTGHSRNARRRGRCPCSADAFPTHAAPCARDGARTCNRTTDAAPHGNGRSGRIWRARKAGRAGWIRMGPAVRARLRGGIRQRHARHHDVRRHPPGQPGPVQEGCARAGQAPRQAAVASSRHRMARLGLAARRYRPPTPSWVAARLSSSYGPVVRAAARGHGLGLGRMEGRGRAITN